ncbi:hypothetical protein NCCP2716_29170 [Sporosarcina sp. NCCP-2716]|uniref:hypothetical protein n=1 Tax=Sporosarcina sp. NCCP-2716 TaxID=2943679 RepID=UPI00203D43A3|nr:hypothetical protein [Sporosarcina sp. NCCP-2716]GKV70419.1 hypothetical protein NCCP2716_29170 [Sporosarcina sp. NCCP-2716]
MKKIFLTLSTVFIAAIIVYMPQSAKASEDFELPRFYNADNQEIFPYNQKEYAEKVNAIFNGGEDLKSNLLSTVYSIPKYYDDFGPGSFTNFVWIRKGKLYKNPLYVNVERINRTTGLAIYYYNSGNSYEGKTVFPKYGNIWHAATVDYLPRGKSYKFKLVSESGELAQVKQGEVGYNN